jgi:hypothetical protein
MRGRPVIAASRRDSVDFPTPPQPRNEDALHLCLRRILPPLKTKKTV